MEKSFGRILRQTLTQEAAGEAGEKLRAQGLRGTWMEVLSQALLEKAAKGDSTAFRLVRDTASEGEGNTLETMSDEALLAMLEEEDG